MVAIYAYNFNLDTNTVGDMYVYLTTSFTRKLRGEKCNVYLQVSYQIIMSEQEWQSHFY